MTTAAVSTLCELADSPLKPDFATEQRAAQIFSHRQQRVYVQTDQMFSWLLMLEYIGGICCALWISPLSWAGVTSQTHVHVWAAIVLGGLIVSLPMALAVLLPGHPCTRYSVAIGQMLMSALLIHLTGGRLETHFHVFGSLAFLAFYRDWRVLLLATSVVAADHYLRGMLWPQSVFGTTSSSVWLWLEHAAWVLFEVFFLMLACRHNLKEMRADALQKAQLERSHRDVEEQVAQRTIELLRAKEQIELAVNGSNDGMWDWNLETDECFFSKRFNELLGYGVNGEPELPPFFPSLVSHLHPDDVPTVLAALDGHLERQEPFDVVCQMKSRSDGWLWCRLRGQAVQSPGESYRRMAGFLSDVSKLKQVEEQLARAALLDQLTGLLNRSHLTQLLCQTLETSRKEGNKFAVMFLDFDRFKIINDSLGHDVGDSLLCAIAQRLCTKLGCSDPLSRAIDGPVAARMGGDEFVVLLNWVESMDEVMKIAGELLASLAQPYQLGPHVVYSSASIGIVVVSGQYERTEDILRDADTAMYEAKRAGKARYAVFDQAMQDGVQRRHRLENDLRRAIVEDQLSLVYQPIVSLETGELASVEALLRWQHPTDGSVSPAEFVPIAEESGQILAIGEWVLQHAMWQMAQWVECLGDAAPSTISINLSRKQFSCRHLAEQIARFAAEAGLNLNRVQLEVTETAFASDVRSAVAAMKAIKDLGVRLAIDDFGTGCATFASLHEFPADVLKIDRSLIEGVETSKDTAALIHSIATLVRNLGMDMVAEGVESGRQTTVLRDLGCEFGQGFYFAQPMTAEELERFAIAQLTKVARPPKSDLLLAIK